MLVREIMTSPVLSVQEDSPIEDALKFMADRRVTALPVVKGEDTLVGILSEMDVLRYAVPHDPRGHLMAHHADSDEMPLTVGEIMTKRPRSTHAGADVADVVELFTTTAIKSLPVVQGQHLVGVVSRSDIIRAICRTDEDIAAEIHSALAEMGQDHWDINVAHAIVTISGPGTPRERDIAAAIIRSVIGVRRIRQGQAAPLADARG